MNVGLGRAVSAEEERQRGTRWSEEGYEPSAGARSPAKGCGAFEKAAELITLLK